MAEEQQPISAPAAAASAAAAAPPQEGEPQSEEVWLLIFLFRNVKVLVPHLKFKALAVMTLCSILFLLHFNF